MPTIAPLNIDPVDTVTVGGREFPKYDPASFPPDMAAFIPTTEAVIVDTGQYESIVADLHDSWRLRRMPFLWGPAGGGKSFVPTAIASLMRVPLFRVQFTEASEASVLLGRVRLVDGESPFVLAPFARLASMPAVVVLDEFNTAPPEPQQAIRSVGDSRRLWIADADTMIEVHDQFWVALTGNPDWDGLNFGLAPLSDADRRRTQGVWVGHPDEATEKAIVLNALAVDGFDVTDKDVVKAIDRAIKTSSTLRGLADFPFAAGVGDTITFAALLSLGRDPVAAFRRTYHGKDPKDIEAGESLLAVIFPPK